MKQKTLVTVYGIFCMIPFLNICFVPNSDASVWSKSLDGPYGDYGQSAGPTSDGGVILCGTTKSGSEAYLMKMSSSGNIQWQKLFAQPGINRGIQLFDVAETNDGGFVAVGGTTAVEEGLDLFLIKTDSQGVVSWLHIYSMHGDEYGLKIRQAQDGTFIIAALSYPVRVGPSDLLLVHLDNEGKMIWQKVFGSTGYEGFPDLQMTSDGNIVIASATTSFGHSQDALAMKFDLSGNVLWSKTYGGRGIEGLSGIHQTSDSGYVITGWTQAQDGNLDLWLSKISSKGSIQWQNQYGGLKNDWASGVAIAKDGGFFVTGITLSFGAGKEDIWLMKLSQTGEILWQETYGGPEGDWPTSIKVSADGGILVTGLDQFPSRRSQNAIVLKLNSLGELNDCSRFALTATSSIIKNSNLGSRNLQFTINDAKLTEIPANDVKMRNGIMKAITDCNLITAINPSSASPGSFIQLTGHDFGQVQEDSRIFIGQHDLGKASSWSDTEINIRIPRNAQTAGLTLRKSNNQTVPIEIPILPPAAKKMWPQNGPQQGKTRVAIQLEPDFDGLHAEKVIFGNQEATNVSLLKGNVLLCTSPPGIGSITVTVVSGIKSFSAGQFTYK